MKLRLTGGITPISIVQVRTDFHSKQPPFSVHGVAVAIPALPFYSMTSRQANQQEDTYFRVMRLLEDRPDLTQRELADQLGVSVSGVNYCLKALIEKGFVKVGNFKKSKNKFKYVYLLTPQGIAEKMRLTSRFLKRKMEEYDTLKSEIDLLKAEITLHRQHNDQQTSKNSVNAQTVRQQK